MEVVSNNYMPGDQRLIQQIVHELKSQGIFDHFRKECIADVDTKPAYQNLRQRVEGSVASFLSLQTWSNDMNKNQIREQLRKNIHDLGFLESGVERIVEQVVNPKITTIFLPRVEDVVYRYLGITKPEQEPPLQPKNVEIRDLLPMDLEAVSPESNHTERNDSINVNNPRIEECTNVDTSSNKCDEDESPPFEELDTVPNVTAHNENSVDSQLSANSGARSHEDSNHGSDTKVCQMDISSMDSQGSQNSFGSHLSIVTSEETKMEISEDSQTRMEKPSGSSVDIATSNGTYDLTDITSNVVEKSEDIPEDVKIENEKVEVIETKPDTKERLSRSDEKKPLDPKSDHKSDRKEKSRSSDKGSSKDRKDEKHSKSSKEKSNSKHYSSSKDKSDTSSLKLKENSSSSSSSSSVKDKEPEIRSSSKIKESSSSSKDKSKNKDKKYPKSSSSHKDLEKSNKDRNNEKHDKDKIKVDKSVVDQTNEKSSKDKLAIDNSEKEKSDREKSRKDKSDKSSRERLDKDRGDKEKSDKEKSRSDKDKSVKDKDKSKKDKGKSDKDKDRSEKDKVRSEKDKVRSEKDKDRSEKDKDRIDKDKDRSEKDKDGTDKDKDKLEKLDKDKAEKEKGYKYDKDVKERVNKDGSDKKKERSDKDKSRSTSSSKERSSSSLSKDKNKSSSSGSKDKIKSSHTDSTLKRSDSKLTSKDVKSEGSDSKSNKGDKKSKEKIRKEEKHTSNSSKHSKDKKKERQVKDDHYSSKDKKGDRRSTDRDSNDGSSSKQSHSNFFTDKKSSHKATPELSISSGSGSHDSSSNSDPIETSSQSLPIKTAGSVSVPNEIPSTFTEMQKLKYLKPKFASNFQEAIKIMKIRKQIAKLERKNQLGLSEIKVRATLQNGFDDSNETITAKEELGNCEVISPVKPDSSKETPSTPIKTTNLSQESWEALEARLAQEMSNINYNTYSLCDEDEDYSISEIVISPAKDVVRHVVDFEKNVAPKPPEVVKECNSEIVEVKEAKQVIEQEVPINEDNSTIEMKEDSVQDKEVTQVEQSIVVNTAETTEEKQTEVLKEARVQVPPKEAEIQAITENADECDMFIKTSGESEDYSQLPSPPCYYLEKPCPSAEERLQLLHDFVLQLEREVETSRRNFSNSHRGTKRKREDFVDVKNNNKADYEQSTEVRKRLRPPNTAISKAIKDKTNQCTDVISSEGFSLPLSPESDISNDKKDEEIGRPGKRRKIGAKGAAQRYSSEDLYKPRPSFVGTRRTRSAKNV